jgi:nicotinate-nucleotide--dimethylbenzimidazole phosphoribosyltransferase
MNETQQKIYTQAKGKWDAIAKPIDSLGVFEDMVARLCAIAGTVNPGDYKRRALLTLCADHGVVAEGVTQTDASVTKVVAENIAHGCSGVNYMAQMAGVDVYAVDIGMRGEAYPDATFGMGHMINRKVQAGTGNLAKEPAMSMEICDRAIEAGKELVRECKEKGYAHVDSSVIFALFRDNIHGSSVVSIPVNLIRTHQNLRLHIISIVHKIIPCIIHAVCHANIVLHHNRTHSVTLGQRMLHKCKLIKSKRNFNRMRSRILRIPILSYKYNAEYASHNQYYTRYNYPYPSMFHAFPPILPAVIHGKMCLGEGSGAMMLFPLLDMTLSIYKNMGTFDDLSIEAYSRDGKPEE